MAVRPNAAARQGIVTDGFAHFNGATITIFNGTQPATGGGSHSDTTLASGTLPSPAFATGANGSRGPASAWNLTVSADGTAGWARITQSGAHIDLSVGEGSGDISLDETTLENGGSISIASGSLTLPGNDS